MYFGAGIPKLKHAIKTLREVWDGTESEWRDQVRQDIQEHELTPLLEKAQTALRAMDELADLLARIHRDCFDTSDGE
ncbi:MAG: hypothetical protein KatS3mg108_1769 [Isosphaeraceae bacterium]|jgi:hypothetical protein|nr:MAG: hypothetical protein KatS3mg108_1769 [Isosphaeraceae bacterium]